MIKLHEWDGGMHEGTPAFDQIVRESPYLLVDGELPWGSWSVHKDNDNPGSSWMVDGVQTARKLFLQHFTSLSAIHNYKEDGDSAAYSMMYWKETPIKQKFLTENKMSFSTDYFRSSKGEEVERNVFDYIRDHLGYRIELQSLKYSTDKQSTTIDIALINRGFSTIVNKRPVYLVLVGQDNKVLELKTNADVTSWQPYMPADTACRPLVHHIQYTISHSILASGRYKLGLWIPDDSNTLRYDPRYAIRCANGSMDWLVIDDKYGINVLVPILPEN